MLRSLIAFFITLLILSGCTTSDSGDTSSSSSSSDTSDTSTSSSTSSSSGSAISRSASDEPYYSQHWHLSVSPSMISSYSVNADADINISEAWEFNKGENIKIAVIDTGIANDHEDLLLYSQYNAYSGAADSSPVIDSEDYEHGTAVAGIINAQINGLGGVGVAPDADLIAINDGVASGGTFSSTIIQAMNHADEQGADIISNSWGTSSVLDSLRDKINDLATNGRNGKGIIFIFAAGNESVSTDGDESALDAVIGVGATSKDNLRASYSNFGSGLDIVAPGGENLGIFTTDIAGTDGYFTGSYLEVDSTQKFVGTSAAAPIVSGVVALMLSANPDLTRTEIQSILQDTADKIGSISYVNGHNIYYGYGKINAGAAVTAAFSY